VDETDDKRAAIPEALLAAGVAVAQDALTVEVTRALAAGGVRSILLKGTSLRGWLYPEDTARRSSDVDLLVDPGLFGRAEEIVAGLGFEPRVPWRDDRTARHWARASSLFELDLHNSVVGVGVSRDAAWAVLAAHTSALTVDGGSLEVLAPDARALMLALHAAKHQHVQALPLRDLERGLATLPGALWEEACQLARALDAVPAFASGLRLVPEGAVVADRLALPYRTTPEVALFESRVPGSVVLNRLVEIPGVRGKLRYAFTRSFPSPEAMRGLDPRARRGRAGLASAYLRRTGWLAVHAVPTLAAVAAARRKARETDDR
jgi:hypothetical protein